jgi:chromosome segregation ATPase
MKRPKCDLPFYFEKDYEKKNEEYMKTKQPRKPTIDYKIKIRDLENEIVHINQNINHSKSKNEQLIKELDQLRESVMAQTKRAEYVEKELEKQEREFFEMKEQIEENNLKDDDVKIIEKINNNQKELVNQNNNMIEKIKFADKEMTRKYAKMRFYEHERAKLNEEEREIIQKWKKEIKDFINTHKNDIEDYKNFDPSSKIINFVENDRDKLFNLERILNKIYCETNLDDIFALVNFFINCTKEVKSNLT